MFELHIDPKADVSTGSIAVSWCLDNQLLADLRNKMITDPQVVIVVKPEDNSLTGNEYYEERYVVPMTELMTYITFRRPGKNNVFAFVSMFHGGRSIVRKVYLSKDRGLYETTLVHNNDDWYCTANYEIPQLSITNPRNTAPRTPITAAPILTVDIPEECFAKKPSKWEQDWVYWLLNDSKAIDQCSFRRRRLFAYSLQPIILLFNLLARFVLCGILPLLLGTRGFNFKYLIHPLTYDLNESFGKSFDGGTVFIRRVKEDSDPRHTEYTFRQMASIVVRKFCLLPFMPPVLGFIVLMFRYHNFAKAVGCMFLLLLCVAVIIGFAMYFAQGGFNDLMTWIEKLFIDKHWFEDAEEIDLLTCGGKPLSVSTLQRKSIRLRYLDLKAKVCKPFAR